MDRLEFSARGVTAAIDLAVGHLADFAVEAEGRVLRPLHRAPWIEEGGLPEGLPAGQARLSGDFLCAPFSTSDVEPAPLHGWPANSRWTVAANAPIPGGRQVRLVLERRVMGATVEKILTLRDGHPFLYQEHVIVGGEGGLPVAHHTMTRMAEGGRLAVSTKRRAETPAAAPEPDPARGRSRLAYPAVSERLDRFPLAGGGTTDLTALEPGTRSEDLLTLVEADHAGLGWTAVARSAERDLVLVLKDPRALPVTMLWLSDGGRDYAPWNGRHTGVLGIEDGRTAVGHRVSLGDNALASEGIPTFFALRPDGRVAFRQAIGVLPGRADGLPPKVVAVTGEGLELRFAGGDALTVSFDPDFLPGV